MKRVFFLMSICIVISLFNCDEFISEQDEQLMKNYEAKTFVIKKKITVNEKSFNKGQRVRINFTVDKESIRVRGRDARTNPLKADNLLLIYVFKEDFPNEKFDKSFFFDKFNEILTPVNK